MWVTGKEKNDGDIGKQPCEVSLKLFSCDHFFCMFLLLQETPRNIFLSSDDVELTFPVSVKIILLWFTRSLIKKVWVFLCVWKLFSSQLFSHLLLLSYFISVKMNLRGTTLNWSMRCLHGYWLIEHETPKAIFRTRGSLNLLYLVYLIQNYINTTLKIRSKKNNISHL